MERKPTLWTWITALRIGSDQIGSAFPDLH